MEHSLFFHILGIIIPTDELIFFRGVATTNQIVIIVITVGNYSFIYLWVFHYSVVYETNQTLLNLKNAMTFATKNVPMSAMEVETILSTVRELEGAIVISTAVHRLGKAGKWGEGICQLDGHGIF